MLLDLLMVFIGYFVGSIPFSYIFPAFKGVDVRKIGSGNVGGTNALRASGSVVGALSMLADILKVFVIVVVARAIGLDSFWVYFTGIAAVVGHDYPVYLKFVGGKGVAGSLGFVFAVVPLMGLEFIGIWLLLTIVTEYVSLSSMVGFLALVLTTVILRWWNLSFVLLILTALIVYRHHSNIRRLVSGKENKTDVVKALKGLFNVGGDTR